MQSLGLLLFVAAFTVKIEDQSLFEYSKKKSISNQVEAGLVPEQRLHGDLLDGLQDTQDSLAAAHMFFQLQLSMLGESFDSYMVTLNQRVLPYLSKGAEDFNEMSEEADDAFTHPTCQAEWRDIQLSFGRQMSECAMFPEWEVEWMLQLHNEFSQIAEYTTNPVQLFGLEAFMDYNPLTDHDEDLLRGLNDRLRDTVQRFLSDDLDVLNFLESYVFDYFEDISFNSYFCIYSLIGRFATAISRLTAEAANGPCTGN
jgi:hypothetical protein